jgi:hypothetical protein
MGGQIDPQRLPISGLHVPSIQEGDLTDHSERPRNQPETPHTSEAIGGSARFRKRDSGVVPKATPSLSQALGYLTSAKGDEIAAAMALALDRNQAEGQERDPDEQEVHHALFLLRRARGLSAPSYDLLRWQLKRRVA